MGTQPMFTGGDSNGGAQTHMGRVMTAVSTLNSPNATPQQKESARKTLIAAIGGRQGGQDVEYAAKNGWIVKDGHLMYIRDGNPRVQPPFTTDSADENTINVKNYMRDKRAAEAKPWSDTKRIIDADPTGVEYEDDWLGRTLSGSGSTSGSLYGLPGDAGPGSDASFESGGAATPGSFDKIDPRWRDSFFSGAQPDSLDELAANPDQAWGLYRMRGGPGGKDLRNSTASIYGENNFRSAMDLAGILGGAGMGPQDTLGFAGSMTGRDISGGGRYTDPAKILNAAFANIGREPDAFIQQEQIGTVLAALEPYMDPTQYRALQSRVGRVMDEYLAYGLENGTDDLSGILLKAIQNAVRM